MDLILGDMSTWNSKWNRPCNITTIVVELGTDIIIRGGTLTLKCLFFYWFRENESVVIHVTVENVLFLLVEKYNE